MGQLFITIRQLVAEEKYVVGLHASELIAERLGASPNPAEEVREILPDGIEFKAVWSFLRLSGVAKLVTVHFFDGGEPCTSPANGSSERD